MGTNFYHVTESKPACECCKRPYEEERLHIGKSSGGWAFSLHVIPEMGINTLADWVDRWNIPGTYIEDEYGDRLTIGEMFSRIAERKGSLMRHPGSIAVGTYDYCEGEFS
jgi:hypothetical protein